MIPIKSISLSKNTLNCNEIFTISVQIIEQRWLAQFSHLNLSDVSNLELKQGVLDDILDEGGVDNGNND